jgi:uncharacterized oxidoreductase
LFGDEMKAFLEWVKASPAQPGFDRVRLAGEPERETRAKRMAEGIPVDETSWNDILTAAERLKVNPKEVSRLAGV